MPESYSKLERRRETEYARDFNYAFTPPHFVEEFPVLTYDAPIKERERLFAGSTTQNWKQFRLANHYLPTREARDSITMRQGVETLQTRVDGYGNVVRWRRTAELLPGPAPELVNDLLVDEAWSKLRRKVLDSDFNAAVFLAEGHKTLDMLVDTAGRLTSMARSLRKGHVGDFLDTLYRGRKKPRAGRNTGGWQDRWLEHRYGWIPLLSDCHGAAVTLAKFNFRRDIQTFYASASESESLSTETFKGLQTKRVKTWATVKIRDPNLVKLNQLGLLNPLTIAWEVTPFSFVADWFVNVGDCLAELTAFAGMQILTGGHHRGTTMTGMVSELNPAPYREKRTMLFTTKVWSRHSGVQEFPRLQVKANPLNWKKLITSAALLKQVLSR